MTRIQTLTKRLKRAVRVTLFTVLSTGVTVSEAALLNLGDVPLYLITSVEPNIVLTFDDSGSMLWGHMPDTINTAAIRDGRMGCSSALNRIYFDPSITYVPPVKEDGSPLNAAPTTFTNAYVNGYNPGAGTVNLSTGYQVTWRPAPFTPNLARCGFADTSGRAAFYYRYNGAGSLTDSANYTLVQHNNGAAGGAWTAAQQLNFANWYSYYRTRNMLAKAAVGRAFSRFGTNVRVAGHHLNGTGATTGSSTNRFPANMPSNALKIFTGANRTDFFTRLYNAPGEGWTPLREAMGRVGAHMQTADPYRDAPGTSSSPERSCRQNYHVMMTDGYWNGLNTQTVTTNADNTGVTLPDSVSYTARAPYADAWSGTLADQAFFYWSTDLRPGQTNNVKARTVDTSTAVVPVYWNPVNNPATWQHLVNFTIGLGIDGTLPFNTATYNNLVSGATQWPDPIGNSQGQRIDDLWHAAINSRGRYFSAANPNDLVSAFTAIVNDVVDRISSASSVALNSGSISSNSFLYQARFNSGFWGGQLLAHPINPTTGQIESPAWDAAVRLSNFHDFSNGRRIVTYKPSSRQGIPFRWPANPASPTADELDTSQSTALNYNTVTAAFDAPSQGQARLNYIRGEAVHEDAGNNYRKRSRPCDPCAAGPNTGFLGDTVNSAPVFVGAPPFDYPDSIQPGNPYSTFKSSNSNRTPVVYVGANDGMLHAFNANNGDEIFAYVPSKVYGNLSNLTAKPFVHKYFVDGDTSFGDVFINGAWKTILVGSLRKGGQGVFALDVTSPTSFSTENTAKNNVLWEFNDTDDVNLGFTYSQPAIAKMSNGKWAVIFGNGYNNSAPDGATSTDGRAYLYILVISDYNPATGWVLNTNYYRVPTGVGSAATPNGLASPAVVDVNADYVADYIYAGDLSGNMWKFDVTGPENSWSDSSKRTLVYAAKDGAGKSQPITVRPEVGRHPTGQAGYMVYFGTGKYLETTDASTAGASTQTFYGIWDGNDLPNPARANLLQQDVLGEQTVSGNTFRIISDKPMIWQSGSPAPKPSYVGWFLDLPTTGERQVTTPVLRGGRIIFTTVIPSDDPCKDGGDGWLMELKAGNGGRPDTTPFDVNGDGVFSDLDLLTFTSGGSTNLVATGGQKFSGIPSSPAVLVGNPVLSPAPGTSKNACPDAASECKLISSSNGSVIPVKEDPDVCINCRASWRQLR